MLNELGVDGILLDLLLTSVISYATKNAEQDVLIWIILILCPSSHGQCQRQGAQQDASFG